MTERIEELARGGFLLKNWTVEIWGTPCRIAAATRGKALADAWRSDAFAHLTFGQFLKSARCRRADNPPNWGEPITVSGRPAFFLGENGQYVQFAKPGGDFVLHSHPYDVLPEAYRPKAYGGDWAKRAAALRARATQ